MDLSSESQQVCRMHTMLSCPPPRDDSKYSGAGPRPVRKPSSHKDRGAQVMTTNHPVTQSECLLYNNETTFTLLFENFDDSRGSKLWETWDTQTTTGSTPLSLGTAVLAPVSTRAADRVRH